MTNDRERHQVDDVEYLRRREADERAAAEDAACMARTAHEDLADEYAERAAAVNQAIMEARVIHERLLSQIDAEDRS